MAETRRVAFFGGQGSKSLFSSELTSFAHANGKASPACAQLLSSCHAAFLNELNSSLTDQPVRFRDELKELTVPGNLISPPAATQNNPIIQGVTLLLHQLLGYLANAQPSGSLRLEPKQGRLSETVGFCSGVLPAIVAASSSDTAEFIAHSRAATRVAFWLGYRAAEFCERQAGEGWRDRPWSIALGGHSVEAVDRYNTDHPSAAEQICISAKNNATSFSVAGSGKALSTFRSQYLESTPDTSSDLVFVHALYHGGPHTEPVVAAVLGDIDERRIVFPAAGDLNVPLRSSITGATVDSSFSETTLAELAIRSILVDQVDWYSTWNAITQSVDETEVLAFGPHSRSLLATAAADGSAKPISIIDLSGKGEKGIPSHADESIAIVGMACQFPQSSDKEMLWQTLEQGLNTVEEVPDSRFEVSQFFTSGEEKGAGRKMAARHGNFLDKPWAFDNKFFNVSPREAKSMDPQQRLLLQGALNALNDAGYVPDSTPTFQKATMGCYIGVATNDYENNLRDEIDVYYSTGTLRAFLSGKISHFFKWSGPSVVTDTACSASSVSLYQACRALRNGDCTAAIAGGVNSISSPDMMLGLSRAHFLSKTGQCKAFDITADGYCRSEGCGLFVLKRLKDAISENDRIYGVIRGIEVNQCGNAHSITHPHSETQQALFKQVLDRSGVDADSVNVIEAHGTGTQAGDAAEVSSIQAVFGNRPSGNPLNLTSVKGNIGHAEAASGAAGLSKILLMMAKKKLPPQTGFNTINPRLASINSHNIRIPTAVEEWKTRRGVPRRALLNNFGAAGSNAALLLEEAPEGKSRLEVPQRSAYPFIISARNPKAVKQYVSDWISQLEASPETKIEDVAYTTTARRMPFEQRLTLSCTSIEDLVQKLRSASDPVSTANIRRKPIGFAFSGQGAVYAGMGKELINTAPVFRQVVRESDQILSELGFPVVTPFLEDKFHAGSDSEAVVVSQCACFVVEYALARLWMSWNIVPDIVMGHSLGEYAAMVTAGILTLYDALRFVAARAKLMTDLCQKNTTSMLACNMPAAAAEELIKFSGEEMVGLTVACQNSKGDCVISGLHASLDAFSTHCKSAGGKCKKLEVPFGFHSSALDPILEPLSRTAETLKLSSPKIAFGSTVTGAILEDGEITPEYFTRQTRGTVLFADLMESLVKRDVYTAATYIEIGPAPITLPMIKSGLSEGDSQFLPSLSNKQSPWMSLTSALNKLVCANYTIDWRKVFDGSEAKLVDAPAYPLDKAEMFVPYKEPTRTELAGVVEPGTTENPKCPLLPRSIPEKEEGKDVFETDTSLLSRFIQGHVVGGVGLCPASLYHEMVLEAATNGDVDGQITGETLVVSDINFDKPLIYNSEADKRVVRLTLEVPGSDKTRRFKFSSFVEGADPKDTINHCFGILRSEKTSKLKTGFTKMAAVAKRQEIHLEGMAKDTFRKRMLYETIFPRVVEYGKKYQSIKDLTVTESGSEGHGHFKLPEPPTDEPFVLSPTFVDTLLHAAGFIANSHVDATEACICTQVEQINILYDGLDQAQEFKVYCSLLDHIEGTLLGDAYAVTSDGAVVASVEGMHFKKLSLKGFQNHLARQAGRGRPQERSVPAKKATSRTGPPPPREQPTQQEAEGVSTDEIVKAVIEIVSKVCEAPLSSISAQSELADLGMDSLMQIELADALKQRFPELNIDKNALLASTTVNDLQDHIVAVSPSPTQASKPSAGKARPMSLDLENTNKRLEQAGETTAEYQPPEAPATKVKELIAEVCGIGADEVDVDATLESLGMDSLMTIELKAAFKKDLGIDMPDISGDFTVDTLLSFASVESSEETSRNASITDADSGVSSPPSSMTSSMPSPTSTSKPAIPQPLQTGSRNIPPMYLFHDGSGTIGMYKGLSKIGCNLYGVANPGFGDSEHWAKSITEIATNYASAIAKSTDKPVVLGGWSFGGVVAFETAQHLQRLGKDVKGVVLIDSPYPKDHQPLPKEVVQHVLKPMTAKGNSASQKSAGTVANQFKQHAQMLGQYEPPKDKSDVPYVMLQSEKTFDTSSQCGVRYPWLEDQRTRSQAIHEWSELLGREMKTLKIPGDHFQPFTPECVGEVSEKLKEAYNIVAGA